jgi:hypothetical protein
MMLLKEPKFRALFHNAAEFHKPYLTYFIHNKHGGEVLTYLCEHIYVQQKHSKNYFGMYFFWFLWILYC